jgi:hypothetical protein
MKLNKKIENKVENKDSNPKKLKESTLKKNNERVHSTFGVSELIRDIKEHLGLILVAEAGHGKSYTAFSIAKTAMKSPDWTVIIISPSTIWKRKFGAIDLIKVGTTAFNPIQETDKAEIQEITFPTLRDSLFVNLDKKYSYVKNAWFESILDAKGHLLLEVKYRNGRKIKHFTSTVLSYIYEAQERAIAKDPDYKHHYLIVLEELQNSFGSYAMNTDDSLDLMTIFTQSRSDAFIHYVGIGQRLNDISTKVIERLRPFIGLTLGDCSLRKIKSQLPENLRDRVQQLPKRHWLYLDGNSNPEIVIPEYKKEGSPTQLKPKVKQPKARTLSLTEKIFKWINPMAYVDQQVKKIAKAQKQTPNILFKSEEKELDNQEKESENLDLEEIEEEWIE